MNCPKKLLLFGILLVVLQFTWAAPVYAAVTDAYWVGGIGHWSDATNHWATSSGGLPDADNLPGTTTNVHFDSNSGGGITTVDSDQTISALNITSGYTGTIIQNANMIISETYSQAGGTFSCANPETYTINVGGTGAPSYTITDTAIFDRPFVSTVKPAGGGNFTTLQDWEDWAGTWIDDEGQSHADQWAEVYTGGNLGTLWIYGWTTAPDATHYPRIYTPLSERHDGTNSSVGAYSDAITIGDFLMRESKV